MSGIYPRQTKKYNKNLQAEIPRRYRQKEMFPSLNLFLFLGYFLDTPESFWL